MKAPQKAIILAAGMATRMLPLSLDTPKPILPLWGKPVIGHIFEPLAPLEGQGSPSKPALQPLPTL